MGAHESCWRAVRSLSIVTTDLNLMNLHQSHFITPLCERTPPHPLTRCPIRRVKTHLASHSWLVFGQNLPKQVNLLRPRLQELEDVLHAGVHGERGAGGAS